MTGLYALIYPSSSILSDGKYTEQVGKINWKIHEDSNNTGIFNWQLFEAERIWNSQYLFQNS